MKLVKPTAMDRDVPRGVVGGAEVSQSTTGAHNIYMAIFRVPAGARGRGFGHEQGSRIWAGGRVRTSMSYRFGNCLYF